jgi:Na+/proline symporter
MTAAIILLMILLYTYEGGVKTIVWTDTLQTTGMLAGLLLCTFYMLQHMGLDLRSALHELAQTPTPKQFPFTQIFFTDPNSKLFWVKQILAGAFITITMTGMDQEMMQKNISVRTLRDSQKNVLTLGFTLIMVIGLFLFLGGLLHLYAFRNGAEWTIIEQNGQMVTRLFLQGKDITADNLFPAMAIRYMPPAFGIIFIIALISALFPSADGAITALTSSFCIDILGLQRRTDLNEGQKKQLRQRVHLLFAALFLVFVLFFKWVNNPSMIGVILKVAGYTYGPLLGLFSFGLLTTRTVKATWTPFICILAPALCFFLDKFQQVWLGKFEIGLELLIINGALTFLGLWLVSAKRAGQP